MKIDLHWLAEIEWKDLLSEDQKLIMDHCGTMVLLSIMESLTGQTLTISSRPIEKARRRYIKDYYNGKNLKRLALECGASMRTAQEVVNEIEQEKDKKKQEKKRAKS